MMADPSAVPNQEEAQADTRTRCVESERPTLLAIIAVSGMAGPFWWPVLEAVKAVAMDPAPWRRSELFGGFILYAAVWMAGFWPSLALHFGRYWAWVAFQIFCALGTVFFCGVALGATATSEVGVARLAAFLLLLLWFYLRGESVKRFCSVSRRMPPAERTPEADG
jgi:hypothetical protein